MKHRAGDEEQIVTEKLRSKVSQINSTAQAHLSVVQHHITFTLQQAYFKCAYKCFDRSRNYDDISNCVEHCSVPLSDAQNLLDDEMATFQERLQRSLMVCQDKYMSSKFNLGQSNAMNDLESCVNQSIDDNIRTLPHIVEKLKIYLGI